MPELVEKTFTAINWGSFYPPYYAEEMKRRILLIHACSKSKELRQIVFDKCKNDLIYFINNFAFTLDPRLIAEGKPALVPFILFPKQEEYIKWRLERIENQEGGAFLKSRDSGGSYIALLHQLHTWLFEKDTSTGLISKKMDLVDRLGDTNTLFGKLREIIKYIPRWLMPSDYFSGYARLVNYDNNCSILGFSGEEAGRSGRLLYTDFDEVAFAPYAKSICKALSQTTNTTFLTSTPNGKSDHFAHEYLREGSKKFSLFWRDDPRKDEEWYQRICAKIGDKRTIAQEIDGSFEESGEDSLFPYHQLEACKNFYDIIDFTRYPIVVAGLDVATTGKNKSILTILVGGCLATHQIEIEETDPTKIAYAVNRLCKGFGVAALCVDLIGVGEGVVSTLQRIVDSFDVIPFRGNGSCTRYYWDSHDCTSKDRFSNIRAEMYHLLQLQIKQTFLFRKGLHHYTQPEMLSFTFDTNLLFSQLEQLTSVKSMNGKLKLPSKEEMKEQGISSPDRADSLMYAIAAFYLGKFT